MRGVLHSRAAALEPAGSDIDLGGIGRAISRRRFWIIGATLVALAAALAFVTLVTPRYTATTQVLVENQESYFTRPSNAQPESQAQPPDDAAIASQVQLVTSRDLARDAIRALDLKGNPEFDPLAGGPSLMSRIMVILGLRRNLSDAATEDRILDAYYERLNVFSVVKSRVLQIEFTSRDPDLAARAANKIAELYINLQADQKRLAAHQAAESLATLNTDLRAKVSQADSKADEFRANAGLIIGGNNLPMTNQQLSDLNTQMSLARAAQADSQAKAKMLRDMLRQGRLADVSDVANNELIRRLSEQRSTLRAQIASESRTLLPGHPRIKELNAQLAELDVQLRNTTDQAARGLENDARIGASRVENLQAALDQQKKTIGGTSADEARARALDREAKLLKDQLEASTAKYQEAVARENSQSTPADARLISRALAPQLPSFPKKLPIILFSVIAGLALSLGTVVAAELMSGRAYISRDAEFHEMEAHEGEEIDDFTPRREIVAEPAESIMATPPVAAAPDDNKTLTRSAVETAPSPLFDLSLADTTQQTARSASRAADRSPDPIRAAAAGFADRVAATPATEFALRVLVTSATIDAPAQGAAVAIGRALADDRRAILVELETVIGEGSRGPAGLGELLGDLASFEDVIHRDSGSRLHLLPAGHGPTDVGVGLNLVLDALSQTYDCVILLAPAVGHGAAATALAKDADYVVLVRADDVTDQEATSAHGELERAGAMEVLVIATESTPDRGRDAA